jgi:hypothetical protein
LQGGTTVDGKSQFRPDIQGSSFIPLMLTHEAFGMLGKPAVDFISTMAIKAGA